MVLRTQRYPGYSAYDIRTAIDMVLNGYGDTYTVLSDQSSDTIIVSISHPYFRTIRARVWIEGDKVLVKTTPPELGDSEAEALFRLISGKLAISKRTVTKAIATKTQETVEEKTVNNSEFSTKILATLGACICLAVLTGGVIAYNTTSRKIPPAAQPTQTTSHSSSPTTSPTPKPTKVPEDMIKVGTLWDVAQSRLDYADYKGLYEVTKKTDDQYKGNLCVESYAYNGDIVTYTINACPSTQTTSTPTPTPTPTATPSPSPSATKKATPKPSATPKATSTPKPTPSATPTSKPTQGGSGSSSGSSGGVYYKNCTAVWQALGHGLHKGDPGYRDALDRDGDGYACEWRPW